MKTKERIFYYDFLRALAILLVILVHTSPFYNWGSVPTTQLNLIISNMLYDLSRVGVPLFFMISGALLLNRDYELGSFLKRRFTRILYPFFFWIFFILIGVYCLSGTGYLLDMFLGINQFTWFIWTLMGIYLFIPIINTFVQRYGMKAVEYYLIIWLFTLFLNEVNFYPMGGFELSFFNGWVGVFVLGYYLDNYEFKLDNLKLCCIGLLIFIVSLFAFVLMNYGGYVQGFYGLHEKIFTIPMTVGVFLFIKYFDSLNSIKDTLFGKFIVSLSICSYGMYFVHIIIVRPFLILYPHQSFLIAAIIYLIVSLGSWFVIYMLSKVPYLKRVVGV